jgi:hypothetical protein
MKKTILYENFIEEYKKNIKDKCKCIDHFIKYNKPPNNIKCSYTYYNNFKTSKMIIYRCCKHLFHI